MNTITIEQVDKMAVITLSGSVTNPVSRDLVRELSEALDDVKQHARGLVLTGGEKFFSIGLNLPELLTLNRAEMSDFWPRFIGVCFDLYTLPMPTGAAVTGHAPAAGTIFAIACDFRYVAEGKKLMGLNEVKIGIPTPYLADLMLRQIVGDRVATEMLYTGAFFMPEQALQMNLVDQVHPQDAVLPSMIERISGLASFYPEAFQAMKKARIEDVVAKYHRNVEAYHEMFLDCWFSDFTQSALKKAAENF